MRALCNVSIISFELITLMLFDEEFKFPLSVEVCLVTQTFSDNVIYHTKKSSAVFCSSMLLMDNSVVADTMDCNMPSLLP